VELPARQKLILQVIEEAVARQGYPPTVREIGLAVGLCSPASVHSHLAGLEAKGYLRRGAAKRRALELVRGSQAKGGETAAPVMVPLVGRVAAGTPILAEQNIEDLISMPSFLTEPEGCFALRVAGSSMVNAGILDGDIVLVKPQDSAQDGDIVVAILDDEATLKRFFREVDHIRLQPENDSMEPIIATDPRIAGRVVGVVRRL